MLELLITLGIVGILAVMAAPSFTDSLRRNARESAMQNLMSSIALARSEGVTQGRTVSICRSTTYAACAASTGADWNVGWIVFVDGGTAGTVDGSDSILQIFNTGNDQQVITLRVGSNATITGDYLQFDEDGFLNNSTSGAYVKYCDADNLAVNARAIWVSNTGRAVLSQDDADGVHNNLSGADLACP